MMDISDGGTHSDVCSVTSLTSSTTVRSTPLLPVKKVKKFHQRKNDNLLRKTLEENPKIEDLSIVESCLKEELNVSKNEESLQDDKMEIRKKKLARLHYLVAFHTVGAQLSLLRYKLKEKETVESTVATVEKRLKILSATAFVVGILSLYHRLFLS